MSSFRCADCGWKCSVNGIGASYSCPNCDDLPTLSDREISSGEKAAAVLGICLIAGIVIACALIVNWLGVAR